MAEEVETIIKYESRFNFGVREIWQKRELLFFFIWRDVKVKYKQTFFGVAWVVFQPLLMMFVFIFVLGERFRKELGDLDYGTFILSGFLLWNVFSSALNGAGNSMVSNSNIIKKIYFPRLIIPISAVASAFFDFFIALVIYIAALMYFRTPIHIVGFFWILPVFLLTAMAAIGSGSMISALNVKYRDFRYILPFMIQALMFMSPVLYPVCQNCGWASKLFAINPMYAPIELFRMHLQGYSPEMGLVLISCGVNFVLLVTGIFTFRKMEHYFADLA